MISNATRFMAAFNDIEAHVRKSLSAAEHEDFSSLALRFGDKQHLLPNQMSALRAFISLRNAISHGQYYGGRPIADPVSKVVEEIERLRAQIAYPPLALAVLGVHPVSCLSPEDSLNDALEQVRNHDYSQFPVYDRGVFIGLLTTNAIARWLANQLAANGGLAEIETVGQVLRFAEPYEKGQLVPRQTRVTDAIFRLSPREGKGAPEVALIVTETGRQEEQPLGLVVAEDLPALYAALM